MNKRNILTAVCALALCPAFAQTSEAVEEKVEYSTDKYKVETNRFWDNWFISAGAGAQIYFGDHDKQQSFGKRLAPGTGCGRGQMVYTRNRCTPHVQRPEEQGCHQAPGR